MIDLLALHERVNRLFEEVFAEKESSPVWSPSVDICETDREFIVIAEVPGIRDSDIQVSLKDNILTIQGYRALHKEFQGGDSGRYHRIECSYGNFKRSFLIPAAVDDTAVKATLKDGLLTIRIPKKRPQTRQIRIE